MTDTKPVAHKPGNALIKPDEAVVREYVEKGRARVANNDGDIQVRILADVLRAETEGEMLSPNAVESAQDVLNEPLEIHSFDLNESEHKSGLGFYAVMSCTLIKTERRTAVQCGAPEVVLKLMRAEDMGWFPLQAKIVELNAGKEGRAPALGLVAIETHDLPFADDYEPESKRDKE